MSATMTKLDASESIFFARELEFIRAQAFEKKYAELKGLQFVPLNTSIDPADEIYTYRVFDSVGMAKMISSYAKDFPRADVSGTEVSSKLKSMGASYGWNLQEIRAARKTGRPLDSRKAMAARRAIDLKMDSIAQTGDTATGLLGLLNQTNALAYTLPSDGTASSKTFEAKTSFQVLRDLHTAVRYMVEQTKDIERPNTMLFPLTTWGYVSTTPMSTIDSTTILEAFLATSPYITTVASWYALETAGSGSVKRLVIYRRDPEVLEFLLPVPFEQFAPEQEKMEFTVACHARTGGVVCYFPLALEYVDGC